MASKSQPVVAAGFIIFRKLENQPEYLLLQTSYGQHHWTPPKVMLILVSQSLKQLCEKQRKRLVLRGIR
ncbi:hypothetical protein RRG08_048702 [Elysia crispata]|uniref:Uncharacterized protein n=1 Tax=Elysia crispata TaxID=231223 RepID=A0AAE1A6J8_9GAST|nr:hypothetical protein RRG08_048702 [Elysia crispata]